MLLSLVVFIASCGNDEVKNLLSEPEVPAHEEKKPLPQKEANVEDLFNKIPQSGVVTLYYYDPERRAFNFLTRDYSYVGGNLDRYRVSSEPHVVFNDPYGNALVFGRDETQVGARGRHVSPNNLTGYRFFNGKVYRKKQADEPAYVDEESRLLNDPIQPENNDHHLEFGPGINQLWLVRIVENDGEGEKADFLIGIHVLENIGGQSVTFRWYHLGGTSQ